MAKAKKAVSKKKKSGKPKKAARKATAKRKTKKPAKKAKGKAKTAPARAAAKGKKTKARKAAAPARKAAPAKTAAAPKKKKQQTIGEGDYQASRRFLKDQAGFVSRNSDKIPAMGQAAERALDGPQGDELRAAEAAARAHAKAGGQE